MVWKAKTSLSELLRRRKQTLQEWMSQMGMTTLDEVHAWAAANDGVVDVPLPKPSKAVIPSAAPMGNVPAEMPLPSVSNVPPTSSVEEKSVEKKIKPVSKKDDDTSSGTS